MRIKCKFKNSVALVVPSSFKKGPKATELYYLAKGISQVGQKVVIYSLDNKSQIEENLFIKGLLSPVSKILRMLMVIDNLAISPFSLRLAAETVFDQLIATLLPQRHSIVVVLPRLVKVAEQAKRFGAVTVLYGAMASPGYNLKLIAKEPFVEKRLNKMIKFHHKQMEYIDHVLALSPFCAKTYMQDGIHSTYVHITPLGINQQKSESRKTYPSKCCFLFIANMQGLKGESYLLKAWEKANLDKSKAELIICGRACDSIFRQMKSLQGKYKNVHYIGYVEKVMEQYKRSSVFVFPTLSEGMPRVVLEAMSWGLPVISTPVVEDLVKDGINGFIINFRDIAALADRLKWFANNPESIPRMGHHSLEIVRRYTWENFELAVEESFKRIIKTRER